MPVANTCNNLAILYRVQNRYNDAEPLYKRAIAIYESEASANRALVNVLENYAELLNATGRTSEANTIAQRAKTKVAQG
jgi:Flp pilus assembly protein TadD